MQAQVSVSLNPICSFSSSGNWNWKTEKRKVWRNFVFHSHFSVFCFSVWVCYVTNFQFQFAEQLKNRKTLIAPFASIASSIRYDNTSCYWCSLSYFILTHPCSRTVFGYFILIAFHAIQYYKKIDKVWYLSLIHIWRCRRAI